MKKREKNIDVLLERNTAEQLAKVDWDGLSTAVSRQLDHAGQGKASRLGLPTVFKVAAGLVAAAAVVFVLVAVRTDIRTGVQFEHAGSAVVELVDSKGVAAIDIKEPLTASRVSVDIGGSSREVAKCDLEIIDVKQEQRKNGSRPAWIIIRMPEPAVADNGASRDEIDLMCLL